MQLPSEISPAEFDEQYKLQPVVWQEAVREICLLHGIPFTNFQTFADGSNLVSAVSNQYVVKIFPKFHRYQWESEWRTLHHLWTNRLDLPIPELIAHGERDDGWTYVIITKLPGVTLESVWSQCSEKERVAILTDIGKMMAAVHSVPVSDLKNLKPAWEGFLDGQVAKCQARHQRLGMATWFLGEVDKFVLANIDVLPREEPVVLTGEYTPFNLLVDGSPGQWRISGMIDFGDAMIGFREYDLLGPILFLVGGNPRLLASLLGGYGRVPRETDQNLSTRLMLLTILHRYSSLKFQIRIPGWEVQVKSIGELQELLFPLDKG